MAVHKLELQIQLPRDRFHLNIHETLETNQIWAIMGASGCGKTSLLRSIAGLENRADGVIRFGDEIWQDSINRTWVPPEQRRIGYIFQEHRLFPHLSVLENLEFARRRATSSHGPALIDVVEQMGIESLLNRGIAKLSGGEKQRVAIARTLLNAPRLLLMDEPMASLDWKSKTSIIPCLRNIHRHFGIPVIMVSHAREEVARLADQLLLLKAGEAIARGGCGQLMNHSGSPLAADDHTLSVLEAQVWRQDPNYPMTELMLEDQQILANRIEGSRGDKVRMVLPAESVSIVLDDISSTSVQNRLPATIDDIKELNNHHMLLSLRLKKQNLQAIVTHRSFDALGLTQGQQVYAHFKAACLDII